jgi:hypothetical protein
MSFLKSTFLIFILGSNFLFPQVPGAVNLNYNSPGSGRAYISVGYTSVTRYNEGFVATGSDGRIDLISITGKITKSQTYPGESFSSVISDNKMIIAAGDNGILRISYNGDGFRKIESGSKRNINSVTIFNGSVVAGADNGTILSGDPGGTLKEIKLNLKGNIVSVSSRITDCYGVTDAGEIIHSRDGAQWDIIDFNKVYAGYYKSCSFTKVLVTENRIAVAGMQTDDSPVIMFSTQGGVWTERPLYYTDGEGIRMFLSDSPNDVIYDAASDLFFMACNNGKLMELPSCSQCNKLSSLQVEDIEGISILEDTMMIVGKNYFIKAVNFR